MFGDDWLLCDDGHYRLPEDKCPEDIKKVDNLMLCEDGRWMLPGQKCFPQQGPDEFWFKIILGGFAILFFGTLVAVGIANIIVWLLFEAFLGGGF